MLNDFNQVGLSIDLLEVHEALRCVRQTIDSEFTDKIGTRYYPEINSSPNFVNVKVMMFPILCGLI